MPRVEEDAGAVSDLVVDNDPKLVAFPVVAI
jgi:hypothetical protein